MHLYFVMYICFKEMNYESSDPPCGRGTKAIECNPRLELNDYKKKDCLYFCGVQKMILNFDLKLIVVDLMSRSWMWSK